MHCTHLRVFLPVGTSRAVPHPDSEGGSHNGEEESVGDKEEEGSGRSARIVGMAAARGAPTE